MALEVNAFELTPSEALQIGFCLGEYERRKKLSNESVEFQLPSLRFFDILISRLLPYSPSQAKWKVSKIALETLPADIEWRKLSIPSNHALAPNFPNADITVLGQVKSFGCAPSTPGLLYTISEREAFAWESACARRSFFDHVVSILKDSLRLETWERMLFLQSLSRRGSNFSVSSSGFSVESDARDEIRGLLSGLVKPDQLTEFELGQQFGTLIAEMDFFGLWISEMKDHIQVGYPYIEGESHTCDLRQIIESVRKHEIVVNCHFAESKLATISNIHCVLNGEIEDQNQAFFDANLMIAEAALEQLRVHKESFWVSVGDVLGTIRNREQSDVKSIAKKSLAKLADIFRSESVDRVIVAINRAQSDLQTDPAMSAWEIIRDLAPLPEAVAKRLWPNDFRNGESFGEVLHLKLKYDRKSKEFRFANISKSLLHYRNQILHDLDRFNCINDEAQFILFGVRVLVRIWKEIEEAKTLGK